MAKKMNDLKGEDKPILIYTDEFEVRKALNKLEEIIIPALGKVKQTFERLQIGAFTVAYLKDLLFNNMEATRKEIMSQIEKETPSRFLMDEALKKSEKLLSSVSEAVNEVFARADQYVICDLLEYPSVDDTGNIVLTETAVQAIRDANSIYATSSKAKELYEVHKAAAVALDRFYQMVKAEITSNTTDLARFFTISEDDKVETEVQDYEYSCYVRGKTRNFI